ncbi:DUF6882 domain-containing protein [Kibdelosporangium persicum]|uniref:Uncharacterized protein n=1 Tax=Kibdelosporangium persicum TaxID=2698649 RepID=A0ABX2FE30_9PSEU|nr:DUF6882 domain-containing protein [Kibdelosporangium persicum]NRN69626.1 hypothetical protein [Kibdelosporangium persicum]
MITFADLQDDAALLSLEHQLRLFDQVGLAAWSTNLDEARFELTRDDGTTVACTDVQLLGSAAPGPRSWLWSWANPTGYRDEVLLAANEARKFGEQHGIAELATAEVPFDALPGAPTDPAVVASHMMEVTKAVTGRFTGYQGPVGGGTRAAFLIDHPDFRLPGPEAPRISRVLQQGLTELSFHDQRRGVDSYARRRGLAVTHDGPRTHIAGPGLTVDIRFTEQNLFGGMSVHMGDKRVPPQYISGN